MADNPRRRLVTTDPVLGLMIGRVPLSIILLTAMVLTYIVFYIILE